MLLPAYAQVITDSIYQTFSDVYKSDVGCRPNLSHWDRDSIAAWFDRRDEQEYHDVEYESYIEELQYEYEAEQEYIAQEDARETRLYEAASEWQDGWA